ncbi:PilN domain-containing protein [Agrococcus sp. Ld7]|uniref:PilN domain-containing protein n=1 Tax=Agrococcus sp. Ld7 TaxID=649148 RepID=UPI0038631EBB
MKVFGLTIGEAPTGGSPLVLGGAPSVDLLPREVRDTRKSNRARRGVIAVAVLAIVATAGGGAAATYASILAEVQLASAEQRTEALLARQSEFVEVTTLQRQIEERTAARQVITGTEIDWQSVLADVRATLPEGAVVTALAVDGASPMEPYAQAGVPLQGPRVATVSITVQSSTIMSAADVVDALEAVPGFTDVQVPTTAVVDAGIAETTFVLHLDEGAYSARYAPLDAGPAETPDAESSSAEASSAETGSAETGAVDAAGTDAEEN